MDELAEVGLDAAQPEDSEAKKEDRRARKEAFKYNYVDAAARSGYRPKGKGVAQVPGFLKDLVRFATAATRAGKGDIIPVSWRAATATETARRGGRR